MSSNPAEKQPKAATLQPTGQYKAALYALRCGDRAVAEYYARNQPRRARTVFEFVNILEKLGWLSPAGMQGLGFATEQLALVPEENGDSKPEPYTRLEFAKQRLARTGANGLEIWSLVTEIGKEEHVANPRDRNWRSPVAAELNEYADLGELARVGDRFYHRAYAPTS